MSDATLEAAALFLIWLRSLACWAVLCGGKIEHDVRVKSAVCSEEKSEINILSISRLKCLSGGINSTSIPLSERAVLHISLDTSEIWSVAFQNDTHSDKNAFWHESKAHLRWQWKLHFILKPLLSNRALLLRRELSAIMKYWLEQLMKGKCSQDGRSQQTLYINMSHGHIMWWYYRQYIALWGMVGLLINVFDHVSHYCHRVWSSTWVMRLSFYMGIKKRPIHCAP